MVIGMGSGVIPIPSSSSCSSRLRYTTDFNDHKDCRRKQQEIDRKLEETQISLQETQILLRYMQEHTANMEEGILKMQEKIDMLMGLARRLENFPNIIYFFTHTLTNCYNGHDYSMKLSSP
jgi:DNA repair ATPase RecN